MPKFVITRIQICMHLKYLKTFHIKWSKNRKNIQQICKKNIKVKRKNFYLFIYLINYLFGQKTTYYFYFSRKYSCCLRKIYLLLKLMHFQFFSEVLQSICNLLIILNSIIYIILSTYLLVLVDSTFKMFFHKQRIFYKDRKILLFH